MELLEYILNNSLYLCTSSLTSVAAEDLLINDSGNGETVKTVGEGLPQLNVEPALAWWNTCALLEPNMCFKAVCVQCGCISTHTHRRNRRCG